MKKSKQRLKVLTANTIVLNDPNGNPRILLDASNEDGFATVTLFAKDRSSINISCDPDSHCAISIHHPDGKTAAVIGVKPDKQSGIELRDDNGVPSVVIASKSKKKPASVLIYDKGKIRNLPKKRK
jgi:hypothetical protein